MAAKGSSVATDFLLVLAVAVAVAAAASEEAQLQHGLGTGAVAVAVAVAPRWQHRRPASAAAPPTAHLHFYFHDTVKGDAPSAVRVAGPADPASKTVFGLVNVMDDPLTEGPDLGSAAVGRAQGIYVASDQAQLGFLQVMNLVLTAGPYSGSSLAVLGRNCPSNAVREMPVIGGTGAFRFARGYAQARTHVFDIDSGYASIEYDVYVMH